MSEPAKKILLVEDEVDAAFILSRRLIHAGYDVAVAHDGTTALEKIKHNPPHLVLLDLLMPAGGGIGFLKALRLSTRTASIPVIIISGCKDEKLRDRAMSMGAQHYVEKPYDLGHVLGLAHLLIFGSEMPAQVRSAPPEVKPMGAPTSPDHGAAASGKTVLVVDDEDDILDVLSMRIKGAGYRIITAKDGEEALTKVFTFHPNLIVLDINLPKINGWYVAMNLKKEESYKNIPIILLSALIQESSEAEKGIDKCDYLMRKPFKHEELISKIAELIR